LFNTWINSVINVDVTLRVFVDHWTGVSYGNTTSGTDSFDNVILDSQHPNTVQPWQDFTFGAIYLAYGDLLT
jgi:hypothetical protein